MIPPLFPYYGSKWRDARRYPAPRCGTVIEPFAGSAGYSLWHTPQRVLLLDIDPIVVGVWQYLIGATPKEILALPDLDAGVSVDTLDLTQEAKWLIGFWLNRGSAQPKKTRTAFSSRTERRQLVWGERARQRIARDLSAVRHWEVQLGSYEDVPHEGDALYFVDPPYVTKGKHYRYSRIDYPDVARWVRLLPGQVVVCEQADAGWLPFCPLASVKSTRGRSEEVVYLQDLGEVAPCNALT